MIHNEHMILWCATYIDSKWLVWTNDDDDYDDVQVALQTGEEYYKGKYEVIINHQ